MEYCIKEEKMNRFFADYKEMEFKCKRINTLIIQVQKQIENLEEASQTLRREYQGNAADTFFIAVNADFIFMYTFLEKVQVIINALSDAINEYQRGEAMVNRRIGDIRL